MLPGGFLCPGEIQIVWWYNSGLFPNEEKSDAMESWIARRKGITGEDLRWHIEVVKYRSEPVSELDII